MDTKLQFFPAGDRAILAKLGDKIDEETNLEVMRFCDAAAGLPEIVELVPAYGTALVHFDDARTNGATLAEKLRRLYEEMPSQAARASKTLLVPVCYGLHFGPDFEDLQARTCLSRQEIISLHTAPDYPIYMLGFLPGFVYLGGMDERLAFPRLSKPRLRIEAGAVGIAGMQTGVYPMASPGGWRIIGRTPISMFDPSAPVPIPVSAGDKIRFLPISVDEFYDIRRAVLKGDYSYEYLEAGEGLFLVGKPSEAEFSGTKSPSDVEVVQSAENGNRPALRVKSAGPFTTVQDLGRIGHQSNGVPETGAMDRSSLQLANLLLGNAPNAAGLEMTALGGSYEFLRDTRFALAGADMQPLLNEKPIPTNKAMEAKAGDLLRLGAAKEGFRAYLALEGGIDVPLVMGSRSTDLKCGMGGFEGRKLKTGDVLRTFGGVKSEPGAPTEAPGLKETSAPLSPDPQGLPKPVPERLKERTAGGVTEIRFVPGPQVSPFEGPGMETFTSSIYTISAASDRMGYRLEGPNISVNGSSDILSEGICFGSVQVPADGRPIVMMADHQTAGGYAKIATICTEDLPLLAQLAPGSKIRFTASKPGAWAAETNEGALDGSSGGAGRA